MPYWMSVIVGLLSEVPGVVWGAVLAALIALGAAVLTNRNSRKQLQQQLDHDAQQRDRERAMALRRDVYLPAAEAMVRAQQSLGQLVNLEVKVEDIERLVTNALTATAKIHLVAGEPIVSAVLNYVNVLMSAYLELITLRYPLLVRAMQAQAHQRVADRANAECVRTLESMKQFNLSLQTNQDTWARLTQQSEAEQAMAQEHGAKVAELMRANTIDGQAMSRRASELTVEIARRFPDAVLAARDELGLPIDHGAYQAMFAKQEADAVKQAGEFFEELRRVMSAPGAPASDQKGGKDAT